MPPEIATISFVYHAILVRKPASLPLLFHVNEFTSLVHKAWTKYASHPNVLRPSINGEKLLPSNKIEKIIRSTLSPPMPANEKVLMVTLKM